MNALASEQLYSEREIFVAALEKTDPRERQAFIEVACRLEPGLRSKVEALLEESNEMDSFLERPAWIPSLSGPTRKLLEASFAEVSEKPGDQIGAYRLLKMLGEGGCGMIYLAQQQYPLRRKVALKVIKSGMDKRVIARFEAERQTLALMEHPNIAKVLDAGTTKAGRPFFVMELVRGSKITEHCDKNRLNLLERLKLFIEICRAIQHAHQKEVIHCDIKPSNILVANQDGVPMPKIIDFGIARATRPSRDDCDTSVTGFGQLIGTPAYMSPEQAGRNGTDIDTRSDIYSLGVMLYELLTGLTPFAPRPDNSLDFEEYCQTFQNQEPICPSSRISSLTESEAAVVAYNRDSEPERLASTLQGELDWIVLKALEKDRSRRYDTAAAFAQDIQCYLQDEPVSARAPSKLYRFKKLIESCSAQLRLW